MLQDADTHHPDLQPSNAINGVRTSAIIVECPYNLNSIATKHGIPSPEQAYILQAHYKHAVTFHCLLLFLSALLQTLQVVPSHRSNKVNIT